MNSLRNRISVCVLVVLGLLGCYAAKRNVVKVKPADVTTPAVSYSESDLPDIYTKAKDSFNEKKYMK